MSATTTLRRQAAHSLRIAALLCVPLALSGAQGGALASASGASLQQAAKAPSVGVSTWLRDLVIPGPELEVAPVDDDTLVVLRKVDVRPHGDAFRYDLVYYGLEPGEYNLLDFLQRKDGSPLAGLQPIPIRVVSLLPEGIVKPNALEPRKLPSFASYKLLAGTLVVLWFVGLIAILRAGRRRADQHAATLARQVTMAERLRPLVTRAMAGELASSQRAELEMLLIAFWRRKRGLDQLGAGEALRRLREDEEAGPLLRQLERWLHQPEPREEVDLGALLLPYESLPAVDEVELAAEQAPGEAVRSR